MVELEQNGKWWRVSRWCESLPEAMAAAAALEAMPNPYAYEAENPDTGETSTPPHRDYGNPVTPSQIDDLGLNSVVQQEETGAIVGEVTLDSQQIGNLLPPIEPRLDGIWDETLIPEHIAQQYGACKTGNCED